MKYQEQKRLEDEQHIRLSGVSISTTIPITPPPDYEQTYRDQLSEPQIPSRDLKPRYFVSNHYDTAKYSIKYFAE